MTTSLSQRRFPTNWKLCCALSLSLFVVGGFVNLLPDIKGTNHFWGHLAWLFQAGESVSFETALGMAFLGVLIAVPALLLGWLIQALLAIARGRSDSLQASRRFTHGC